MNISNRPQRNRLLVMKFGGTSIGSGDAIRRVASIIVDQLDRHLVVVTSAMSGVTDELLELTERAVAGDESSCWRRLRSLRERHLEAAREIAPEGPAWVTLSLELSRLEAAVWRLLGEPATRSSVEARLAGWGELLAVLLVTGALQDRRVAAAACLEPLVVLRSGTVGNAPVPEMSLTRQAVSDFAGRLEAPGGITLDGGSGSLGGDGAGSAGAATVVVVPGFIGRTVDGRITTLGRGGSDYSATILAAALEAMACWIYTDVDGVLTADPRIVPEARVLPCISAATAGRLSHCGARVLHPRSVAPVARTGIELRVRNTFSPENAGTLIIADTILDLDGPGALHLPHHPVVAGRRHLCAVGLAGSGLPEIPHLFGRLCQAAFSAGAEIVQAPQPVPGHDPLVIVDAGDARRVTEALMAEFALEREQSLVAGVVAQAGLALCSVVGDELPAAFLPGRTQAALADAGIGWLHQSVSADVYSCVVAESQLDAAIRCIHADLQAWFASPGQEGREVPCREESVIW
jgi:aspartate kinase